MTRMGAEWFVHPGQVGRARDRDGRVYLAVMLINICWPNSLASGRALFNCGWITLLVMTVIVILGALYEVTARPDKKISKHRSDKKWTLASLTTSKWP